MSKAKKTGRCLRATGNCLLILLLIVGTAVGQTTNASRKGTLLLAGGSLSLDKLGKSVIDKFVSIAGGTDINLVFIPTASSGIKLDSGFIYTPPDTNTESVNTREFEQELAKLFGINRVTVLHTRNRKTANEEKFVQPLRQAKVVWMSEGNSGRLADTYLDTLTEKEIKAVLNRGGVVAGNSAGAIIQGSFIVRGRPDKPVLMAKGHERGFGLLKNVAINPHLTAAKREVELVNVVDAHPELLGIGIDEKTAIVVQGDRFEVVGEGQVAIYDNKKHGDLWYYWLKPGTFFDLRTRAAVQ
jgi:cyanophycinase